MNIIDAHLHCFAQEIPDLSRYGEHQLVAAVIMGAGHSGNGPAIPPHLPDKAFYCCGLRGEGITPENTPALLRQFDTVLNDKRCVGMKFYSGYDRVFPADPRHFPFLDLLQTHGKTLVIHSGETAGSHGLLEFSHPLKIDALAARYPKLNIVIAHFGNPWIVDATAVAARHPHVSIDLSGLFEGECSPRTAFAKLGRYINFVQTWIEYLNDDSKFMFGTDWPLVDTAEYTELMLKIIPAESHEKIFFGNAVRIFGLEPLL